MPNETEVPPQQGQPEEGGQPYEPFHLRERIEEMILYAREPVTQFPRKDRALSDKLKEIMTDLYELSIQSDNRHMRKTTANNLDDKLDVLRGFVRLAANKKLHGGKYPPPLNMHQYEIWARYNDEIGRILGGYLKTLK